MFRRVLVANRGEIAQRIIRTCRQMGVESVAAYSLADRLSPHLAQADACVCIGPAPAPESYLNREALLQAAVNTRCQALHPGYGFLAEDPQFAAMCLEAGVTFIGPSPRAIRLMGLKSAARRVMGEAGVPPIPGSAGLLASREEALAAAHAAGGWPVLLKADSGGGGRGIRECGGPPELAAVFEEAAAEAQAAFGRPALYLEKLIRPARHVEFQVLGDSWGGLIHLGERECSVQRRHQKLVEESPSPAVDPELRREMGGRIVAALAGIGYRSAGTVEMLMDGGGVLRFLEMNTRLQVEHPVTEMVTGVDIVREQIRVAANERLPLAQAEVMLRGHAIECRINAEDPARGFAPSAGRITRFAADLEAGPGRVRLDTHVAAGYEIPGWYDSLIAKLIAWGETREEALETMRRAIVRLEIVGVKTTIPLHLDLLASGEFRSGTYDTGLLERLLGADRLGAG